MDTTREFRRGFWAEGVPFVWLSGIAVLLLIGMIVGLVGLILANGITNFWPSSMAKFTMKDGTYVLGQIIRQETPKEAEKGSRTQIKVANRDLYGLDFKWIDDRDVALTEYPADAAVIERLEYGNINGFITGLRKGETLMPSTAAGFYETLSDALDTVRSDSARINELRARIESGRGGLSELEVKMRKLEDEPDSRMPEAQMKMRELQQRHNALSAELSGGLKGMEDELAKLQAGVDYYAMEVAVSGVGVRQVPLKKTVAIYRPNSMGVGGKIARYAGNVWRFLHDWPRESNTEGGVFPAIFGTVMMVFLMVIICTPLGVMTALYMHEYARPGFILSVVRLAVNNLAGVPSIVFGIFGLGFFIYFVGGGIDRMFFADTLPEPTFGTGGILWASLTLALLTVPVVVVSTLEGLAAIPRANREGALALGASKFQTIWNVILPNAMPGILTGVILAISRAAGEVAPLMITGVVKLTSALPVDSTWPFMHLDRKFMHLGFHIFDVGFQSPNVEAAKPMVYTTTGLLLLIVVVLNAIAIILRNNLRKKYRGAAL